MKTYRKIIWDMESLRVIERIGEQEYSGPVDRMCGATSAEKTAQGQEASIAGMMSQDAQTIFGQNENILNGLNASIAPVVAAGPSQYGFSAPEDAAMRTQATQQITAAGNNASNVARSAAASEGGGNTYTPSGSQAALDANLAETQAYQQSGAQLGITQKGYAQGNQNYEEAVGQEAAVPGELENPATTAGTATVNANEASMQGAQEIQQADDAWMAPVAGIIGDVATGGLGLLKPSSGSNGGEKTGG